jgi:cis-3-alkyl-4-acyloxetan-2-one decarboxylase
MKLTDTFVHRWLRIPYTLSSSVKNPSGRRVVVFLHGIGNSKKAWKEVTKGLPPHIKAVSVDLLGFGASPKPQWATYNAKTQARSVQQTLFSLGIFGNVTIVGHSLGALVAIEMARRYPLVVKQLVLCSPPLYRPEAADERGISPEKLLRRSFRLAIKRPHEFMQLARVVSRYNILNRSFHIDDATIGPYMATLETMIVNQTSLEDIKRLSLPVHIMKGALDPLIVTSNYTTLQKKRKNVTLQTVAAGHEVIGVYAEAVRNYTMNVLAAPKKR